MFIFPKSRYQKTYCFGIGVKRHTGTEDVQATPGPPGISAHNPLCPNNHGFVVDLSKGGSGGAERDKQAPCDPSDTPVNQGNPHLRSHRGYRC